MQALKRLKGAASGYIMEFSLEKSSTALGMIALNMARLF